MDKGLDNGLTSAEVSQLWATYMSDSSQICVLSYFLQIVKESDIKNILQFTNDAATVHLQKIAEMFEEDGRVIPHGFRVDEDVRSMAPKIYTDDFIIEYLHEFSKIGLRGHATNLSVSVRNDCSDFFKQCIDDSVELYERTKELLLSKGLYNRSPMIEKEQEVDYIEHQNFLAGFFGDKRALTALEITNLYNNFERNAFGAATLIGFIQMTDSNEVLKHLIRGKEIAEKHCEILGSYLKKNDLPTSVYWDSEVVENKQPVFSDKLLMYIASALTSVGTSFYGLGIGTSQRRDLAAMYNRFLAEVQLYSEDGANIMIKNRWLESPPKASHS
ncbi:DUF3231 family protein [Halalkalibacter okhensis]|uniref:DUF3231 family protein n=1 Tax=Halalkalibacter okhensis TaxID=333138 RepID=A0A0B0IQQ6_9BACI|nr:DUF3231 family protein [Halalkalibacter okhensis]KHF42011.1 hypothetical protein LQ50_01605 [Halalkalibacter okhensis]